jgi:hypothetical protein
VHINLNVVVHLIAPLRIPAWNVKHMATHEKEVGLLQNTGILLFQQHEVGKGPGHDDDCTLLDNKCTLKLTGRMRPKRTRQHHTTEFLVYNVKRATEVTN